MVALLKGVSPAFWSAAARRRCFKARHVAPSKAVTRHRTPYIAFDLGDIDGMLSLCVAIMCAGLPWANAFDGTRRVMKKRLRHYQKLLRE
ncbi:MAG: hypothetical protein ACYDC8_16110 [Gammaproteobacteria bacterium]